MIEDKEKKKAQRRLDSLAYKDRFQFVLCVNDNVVCQRYFHIRSFNPAGLESEEFYETMHEVVSLIKSDLESKSRVYQWYSNAVPTKLTGFINNIEDYDELSRRAILDNHPTENKMTIVRTDGTLDELSEKTYAIEKRTEYNDRPADGEFVFKFKFLVDDNVVYETAWDGNVYPNFVRNAVDLSNSSVMYRDRDISTLPFNLALVYHMTNGKSNVMLDIIRKIEGSLNKSREEYTWATTYGNDNGKNGRKYYYTTPAKSWGNALYQKTRRYLDWVNNNISQSKLDYIDKYK